MCLHGVHICVAGTCTSRCMCACDCVRGRGGRAAAVTSHAASQPVLCEHGGWSSLLQGTPPPLLPSLLQGPGSTEDEASRLMQAPPRAVKSVVTARLRGIACGCFRRCTASSRRWVCVSSPPRRTSRPSATADPWSRRAAAVTQPHGRHRRYCPWKSRCRRSSAKDPAEPLASHGRCTAPPA